MYRENISRYHKAFTINEVKTKRKVPSVRYVAVKIDIVGRNVTRQNRNMIAIKIAHTFVSLENYKRFNYIKMCPEEREFKLELHTE